MTGWRAALRVARRSVRRHLGRSLLVIALIALPVAGATVTDGLVRTMTDWEVDRDRAMGTADARIYLNNRIRVDIRDLPPGSRVVPLGIDYNTGSLRLAVGDRIVRTRPDLVALGDPLTEHLARLTSGRLPKNPYEALVTAPLAERLGLLDGEGRLRPGATLRPVNGPPVAVTGLALKPYCLRCADVVAPPDTVLKKAILDGYGGPLSYLVDLPDGVDAAALEATWPFPMSIFVPRDDFRDDTPISGYLRGAAGGPVALFAGLGMVGIVVTAGAAFTVGARRQIRDLGLVAVNGGTAKHVRRIVLAQGLVLGVLGAVTGLLVGAAATVLGVPLWQRMTNQLIENPRFGSGDLAVAAGVGIVASVAAATVPAFGVARLLPVDALAGRFRTSAPKARLSLLGVLLVLAGTGAVIVSGVAGHHLLHQRYTNLSAPVTPVDSPLPVIGILIGAMVTVTGLVLVMPTLVTAVGWFGDRLPLAGRLAVRDAVRHRHRTVAAGAAVMVAVAGSVVAAFVFTSRADTEPRTLPADTALAQLDRLDKNGVVVDRERTLDQVATNATRSVPGVVVDEVTLVSAQRTPNQRYPILAGQERATRGGVAATDPPAPACWSAYARVGVGTPEVIELVTGRKPDAGTRSARSALARGEVVVFDKCLVNQDGTVTLGLNEVNPGRVPAHLGARAPGTEERDEYLPTAFISTETAEAHGWFPYPGAVTVTYRSPDDLDAVRAAAEDAGVDLYVSEAVGGDVTGLYLALAGVAALVAFLGAGMTVALSATDGRADLATLAALGAPPRRRRALAGAQALVVTTLGTLAGVLLGVCAGYAAVPVAGLPSVSVPWQQLSLTVLAVPLLAAALAVLVTPSRLALRERS